MKCQSSQIYRDEFLKVEALNQEGKQQRDKIFKSATHAWCVIAQSAFPSSHGDQEILNCYDAVGEGKQKGEHSGWNSRHGILCGSANGHVHIIQKEYSSDFEIGPHGVVPSGHKIIILLPTLLCAGITGV